MKRFKHINAGSLADAASLLKGSGGKARVIAGGTDLLGQMRDNILPEYPGVLVNIKGISGLDYIREENGALHIGALTRLDDIAKNKVVREKYSMLAEASRVTASPHIREMGTLGGNVCQSNRCWYYWVPDNRFYCLRKGGKMCYALTGDGRYHSIFGDTRVHRTPCSTGCPANIDIPSYLSKIREGNLAEAARILLESNPMPAITGRVCPHLCESECNRDYLDAPVAIRCLERFIGDYILENPKIMAAPLKIETKKHVAIIGSGPAGLSAAYYLKRLGYGVTIYEGLAEPGGMLAHGIPPYRLPKYIVTGLTEALLKTGVQWRLNTRLGKDITIEELGKSFNAVFLACGAGKERRLGIKGERSLMSGMEFLRNSSSGLRAVPGRKIAVIGGGNVAVDVARTLVRLGAEPVVVYRRGRAEMPALQEEVDKAEQEGVQIQPLTIPIAAAKKDGRIMLRCTRMELGAPDETGRPGPVPIKGSEFTIEFDAAMAALGEEPDLSVIPDELREGMVQRKAGTAMLHLGANIFAGGDFVSGPATVVQAIAAGRQAASDIDRYLGGTAKQSAEKNSDGMKSPETFNSSYLKIAGRVHIPELPVKERIKSLDAEDTAGLDSNAVEIEANRCFNCGCVAVNSSDLAPVLLALDARIKTTKRVIAADNFFTVNGDKTTVLDDDEIVAEIEIPAPGPGTRYKFIKFALRKSIDFPIVNCAAAIEKERGVAKRARICLNAVYNQPYRATGAEEYITGRPINEATAAAAARKATATALPLVNNEYKIQIAQALVKRVILACV